MGKSSLNKKDILEKISNITSQRGFHLIDLGTSGHKEWLEMNKMQHSQVLEKDHCYLYIPIPDAFSNYEIAYKKKENRLFSTLKVTEEIHYNIAEFSVINSPPICSFSRLFIEDQFVVFSSISHNSDFQPDALAIKYKDLIDVYEKCFVGLTELEINQHIKDYNRGSLAKGLSMNLN